MPQAETRMYILTDTRANNNKFWEVSIDEAGHVNSRYGRVGAKGATRALGHGEALFNRKIREKERKGYKQIDIVGAPKAEGMGGAQLASAAEEQIGRGDPVISDLVRQLARINRHQLLAATGGQMDMDLTTGIISTPIGVVTADNISRARKILMDLEPFVRSEDFDDRSFMDALEQYLMLVPQKVGSRQGWHRDVIPGTDALTEQGALLDQLESSIEIAEQRMKDAAKKPGEKPQQIFDVKMELSNNPWLRQKVEAFYEKGRSTRHESLNYAYGYWDGGARDDRCFMFLADVAMGTPWHPTRTGASVKPPKGFDSVYARGGQDRVMNNEMIVYRTSQARLKYLVEFTA